MTAPVFLYNIPIVCYDKKTEITAVCCAFWGERLLIITLLRRFFPNAQLVFATTTPMNPDGGSIGGINPRSNESIDKYNKTASRIAMENGVEINDLNQYMKMENK